VLISIGLVSTFAVAI